MLNRGMRQHCMAKQGEQHFEAATTTAASCNCTIVCPPPWTSRAWTVDPPDPFASRRLHNSDAASVLPVVVVIPELPVKNFRRYIYLYYYYVYYSGHGRGAVVVRLQRDGQRDRHAGRARARHAGAVRARARAVVVRLQRARDGQRDRHAGRARARHVRARAVRRHGQRVVRALGVHYCPVGLDVTDDDCMRRTLLPLHTHPSLTLSSMPLLTHLHFNCLLTGG